MLDHHVHVHVQGNTVLIKSVLSPTCSMSDNEDLIDNGGAKLSPEGTDDEKMEKCTSDDGKWCLIC